MTIGTNASMLLLAYKRYFGFWKKKTEKRLLNETWLFRQNFNKTTFHVITQISPKKIINMRGL